MISKSVQTEFLRLEDKFLVPVDQLNDLKRLMEMNLKGNWDQYHIRSIYFDSLNLDLFAQHINNLEQRYKLRVRTYSQNEEFSNSIFFAEYKKKEQGLTEKKRFQIDGALKDNLMHGQSFESEKVVLQFNPDTKPKQIKKVVGSVNKLMEKYHLMPVMQVSYARTAMERDGLRLTIDDNLQYVPLSESSFFKSSMNINSEAFNRFQSYKNAYHPESHVVLEVKHMNNFPTWLTGFLNETLILPARFSKYCWAVGNVISMKESI